MEAQQHHQISDVHDQATGSNSRQTSTRWTPTSDQIRILKEIYHNTGLRSPNTEQIQRISARLRQYGKIEGKNVFYWFQNHKARERQQMKMVKNGTNAANVLHDAASAANTHHHHHHHRHLLPLRSHDHNDYVINRSWKYPCFTAQGYYHTSSSSASDGPIISANGQMGNQYHCGYESVNMEQHFRGCSISPLASSSGFNGGNVSYNNLSSWDSMDKFCSRSYNLFDTRKPPSHLEGPEYEEEGGCGARRTLPLFPMHAGEDHRINHQSDGYDHRGGCINGSPFASLELSLNSCTRESRD